MTKEFKTPIYVTIGSHHLDFLREKRIFLAQDRDWTPGWVKLGMKVKFSAPVIVEPYCNQRVGPRFCNIGSFSYTRSSLPSSVEVGRYCAIAENVSVMGVNHPMDRVSVCGFDYSSLNPIFRSAMADHGKKIAQPYPSNRDKPAPLISHDVWIGDGVLLARGITLGVGSVIAARAVVTKDVPPYSLVAGNPGRVKKLRFDEMLVKDLLATEWWRYGFFDFGSLNTRNPKIFVDNFSTWLSSSGAEQFKPTVIALHEQLPAL